MSKPMDLDAASSANERQTNATSEQSVEPGGLRNSKCQCSCADRLDALAALRPRLESMRDVIGSNITPCHDPDCEHCRADVTLRDLLALLPEGGQ